MRSRCASCQCVLFGERFSAARAPARSSRQLCGQHSLNANLRGLLRASTVLIFSAVSGRANQHGKEPQHGECVVSMSRLSSGLLLRNAEPQHQDSSEREKMFATLSSVPGLSGMKHEIRSVRRKNRQTKMTRFCFYNNGLSNGW